MRKNLSEQREPIFYRYRDFFPGYLWDRFCCCIRRDERKLRDYRVYEAARDRLKKELDIVNIVRLLRVSKLMAKMLLKSRQRKFGWAVSKDYVIDARELPTTKVHPWKEEKKQFRILEPK